MKPKIICHIMSSVDGRLLNDRWTEPYDGTPASDLLQVYASIGSELSTDAWMFGKNTLRAIFPYKWNIDGHTIPSDYPAVFIGERHSDRMFIVTDPEADIDFTSSVLRGDNILVIMERNATEEYLTHLREKRISYLIVNDATDLREGFEAVGREFGIRSISVQGGGILNGALLADGLIDELSLVVYPGIDGLSGVPSIFEYVGGQTNYPAAGQSMRLFSVSQREHGIIWLRYQFYKKSNNE